MILGQFKEALNNNGVESFSAVGEIFDPHCHEAVEMITTDEYPSGTVIEESLCGYKMGEKTLRPARVKVAKRAPPEAEVTATECEE
jgi:molecular chaperone GrpE